MGDSGGFWGAGQGEEEKGLGVTENLGWGEEGFWGGMWRVWGDKSDKSDEGSPSPVFDFKPKGHLELGEGLDIIRQK